MQPMDFDPAALYQSLYGSYGQLMPPVPQPINAPQLPAMQPQPAHGAQQGATNQPGLLGQTPEQMKQQRDYMNAVNNQQMLTSLMGGPLGITPVAVQPPSPSGQARAPATQNQDPQGPMSPDFLKYAMSHIFGGH